MTLRMRTRFEASKQAKSVSAEGVCGHQMTGRRGYVLFTCSGQYDKLTCTKISLALYMLGDNVLLKTVAGVWATDNCIDGITIQGTQLFGTSSVG